ncbi:hypothetical protein ACGFK1_13780 [Mycobacterium sp. NPDC048908]|uniref:hypothetical protein n=1 Tax=Mycobacterium sp. NPDC048908 TaxID=3364292 RepID=UPI003715F9ED
MTAAIDAAAVTALADEPIDWRFKGMPSAWWGSTPRDVCAQAPDLFEAGVIGPVCVLRADSVVSKLNDQHAYLQLGGADSVQVGSWLGFGISHPCTVFDKWHVLLSGPGQQAARPSSGPA